MNNSDKIKLLKHLDKCHRTINEQPHYNYYLLLEETKIILKSDKLISISTTLKAPLGSYYY